jgi:hypothetical protein
MIFLSRPPETTARSPLWPAVRRHHLHLHSTCAACGTRWFVAVHHVKPFHLFPELELDPTNLISLCEGPIKRHHLKVGHTVDGHSSWSLNNPNVVADAECMSDAKLTRKGPR